MTIPFTIGKTSVFIFPKKKEATYLYTNKEYLSRIRSLIKERNENHVIDFISSLLTYKSITFNYTDRRDDYIAFFNREADIAINVCNDTDIMINSENTVFVGEGVVVSKERFNSHYFICTQCTGITKNILMQRISGEHNKYCERCITSLVTEEVLHVCRHRPGYHRQDNCEECTHLRVRDESNVVKAYNTDVLKCFSKGNQFRRTELDLMNGRETNKTEITPLYLGVELEAVVKDMDKFKRNGSSSLVLNHYHNTAKGVYDSVKHFAILKADSSVRDGFEIVSLPCTLSYHKGIKKYKKGKYVYDGGAWKAFFEKHAKSLKAFQTDCCGLHVHVSRNWFTFLEQAKFIAFYNDPVNYGFLSEIAGRELSESQHYFHAKKHLKNFRSIFDVEEKLFKRELKMGEKGSLIERRVPNTDAVGNVLKTLREKFDDDHHSATPISNKNKGKTIEVRIFKGNVSKFGFFKVLEFVDASAHFVKDTSITKLNFKDFLQWFDGSSVKEFKTTFTRKKLEYDIRLDKNIVMPEQAIRKEILETRIENNKRKTYPTLARWLVIHKYIPNIDKEFDIKKIKGENLQKLKDKSPDKLDKSLQESA